MAGKGKFFMLMAVALLTVAIFGSSATASSIDYVGQIQLGNAGGSAWSVGHTAVSNPVTPSGGYTQYTSGDIPFVIDPYSNFRVSFDDADQSGGLSDGDKIEWGGTLNIYDYSGSPFSSLTVGSDIGDMHFRSKLEVGGTAAGNYTHGLSGLMKFEVEFTGSASNANFYAGDRITEAIARFQDAAFSTHFNGIRQSANGDLEFALWGDNRIERGGDPVGKLLTANGRQIDNFAFGLDTVVTAKAVPLPPAALLGLAVMGMFGGWKRLRRGSEDE